VPLYDYDCANCGRRFEVIHGVYADPPAACPLCGGGPVRKAIQAPAVHFKGSGWAKKERRATAAPGKAASSDTDSAGDGAAAKPAAGTSASADSGSTGGDGGDRASSTTAKPTDKASAKTTSTASTDD
jgi:putative FmdB family regulatory protein